MNPDRFLEEQAIQAAPAKRAPNPYSKRITNPYSKARVVRAPEDAAAMPVAAPSVNLGETQPGFPDEMMQAPSLQTPRELSEPPAPYPGMSHFGQEDMRETGMGKTRGSDLEKTVYQSPEEFLRHQQTVEGSPLIKGLEEGANNAHELTKAFLANYPKDQTDLTPVMGLADYLAKGKGHAQDAYKRPQNFEEVTKSVSDLLHGEQAARQQAAQLAMEEAGPLKSGQTNLTDKSEISNKRDQGWKIPHPPLMNPFQVVQGVGHAYAENPEVKQANQDVESVNQAYLALQNPSWLADTSLKASIIQGMGVNRITQNELTTYGQGSPDLLNRARVAFDRAMNGNSLSATDRHTIQEFADARMRAAMNKREQVHQAFQSTYGSFLPPDKIGSITHQGDVQPNMKMEDPGAGDKRAQDMANRIMELMKQGGK